MSTVEELAKLIVEKGEEIRSLKAAKAPKDQIEPAVQALLSLKVQYMSANGGVAYDPPKAAEPPKKEKIVVAAPLVEKEKEGPSKKELNKLARKEKAKAWKSSDKDGAGADSSVAEATLSITGAISTPTASPNTLYWHPKSPSPDVSRIAASIAGYLFELRSTADTAPHLPYLVSTGDAACVSSLSGDTCVARYISRSSSSPEGQALYHTRGAWEASEIDQWLDLTAAYSQMYSASAPAEAAVVAALSPLLDKHLADKTFVVGHELSLADIALFQLIKRISAATDASPSLSRWMALVDAALPKLSAATAVAVAKAPSAGKAKAPSAPADAADAAAAGAGEDEGGTCPPLEGAVDGAVCTRFPPEPSGYLHIGHAKAVLLNQYYAQRYQGRLLVRFDDTNPSKEKEEFQENIIQDLATLGVKADSVSHTSDHFAKCEELARLMLQQGKAYMDDTDQEKMQAERLERKESYRRDSSVDENLAIFEQLLKGEPAAQKFCMRAKIDMSSVNGTMRDPVLYRFNDTPHHRTGTKHKAYPTYDFACPVVDSIEGVTHALRTTEYNDRDEQYHWLQSALGLRPVRIQAFGKMNFVYTVLSKRKLNWFVENKLVEGWFDPRFPTIQGCVRRGVNVEALKSFILSQGASRRIITMEWDKFWAVNKKILEESSPRYMGVSVADAVEFTVQNLPDEIEAVSVPLHPSKPEMGTRVMRRFNKMWLDQADAASFKEGEEVTFLRWGNFFIDKIEKAGDGKVRALSGRHNPDATNFSKTKKTTWLAAVPDLVHCQLVEFDHLISKPKLDEEESFQDFVNPNTRFESSALCDPCLRTLPAGQVIQLERKGFFRIDKAYGGSEDSPAVLFAIPDGKPKAQPQTATSSTVDNKKKK